MGRPILRAEERATINKPLKDIMIGDEASDVRSYLQISYPMENGIIKNWTDMELLWDYAFFNQMQLPTTSGGKILLTEPPMNPVKIESKCVKLCLRSMTLVVFMLQSKPY